MKYPCYLVRFTNGAWLKQIIYANRTIKGYTITHEWQEAKHFATAELPEMLNFVRLVKDNAGVYAVHLAEPEFVDLATIKLQP